jgi:hypothetical protein
MLHGFPISPPGSEPQQTAELKDEVIRDHYVPARPLVKAKSP